MFNLIEHKLPGHIEINSTLKQGAACVIILSVLFTENS